MRVSGRAPIISIDTEEEDLIAIAADDMRLTPERRRASVPAGRRTAIRHSAPVAPADAPARPRTVGRFIPAPVHTGESDVSIPSVRQRELEATRMLGRAIAAREELYAEASRMQAEFEERLEVTRRKLRRLGHLAGESVR